MNTPKPPPVQQTYQPPNQAQAGQGFFGGVSALQPAAQSYAGYAMPQIQSAVQNIVNNPYAAQQQTGVNTAANYASGTLAPMEAANAGTLSGLGTTAAQYAPQALQAGFDPQRDLYNRTQQQVGEQSNAINSMYGLSASPYGAGVANQNNTNFNIDWQNQQLARQGQAANTYGALSGAAGQAYGQAGQAGAGSVTAGMTGATAPYQNYAGVQSGNISALGQGGTAGTAAQSPAQQFIQDFAQYLGIGQNAAVNQNNAQSQRYQNQLAGIQMQNQELMQIGEAAGSMAMGLPPGTFSSMSSMFGGNPGGLSSTELMTLGL